MALLIILTISNCLEIIGYYYHTNPEAIEIFLRIYYVSLIMLFAFLVQFSLLTIFDNVDNRVDLANFGLATLLSFSMLFTDLIVAGASSIGYTVTREAGAAYWIFQIYAILMLISALLILMIGYRYTKNQFTKIQALYVLMAVFLLALPIIVAIAAMALGFKINAAFILPIGITLFLCLITYAIKNDKLFDIRIWLPFSTRCKLLRAIYAEFQISKDGSEMSAKERKRNHERIFLLKALLDYKGYLNQKEIAEKMGISESSLSKKRKEYRI